MPTMDDTKVQSFLDSLERRHAAVMGFLASYTDLTTVIDTALLTANALAYGTTLNLGAKSIAKTHCGLMWQTAADYQRQSLIHILARELDAGFALLRMATELARDAYVIGKDERRLDLWLNREEQAEEYRKRFKFDQTIPEGNLHLIFTSCVPASAYMDIRPLCSMPNQPAKRPRTEMV
jgi:hypothetical protein